MLDPPASHRGEFDFGPLNWTTAFDQGFPVLPSQVVKELYLKPAAKKPHAVSDTWELNTKSIVSDFDGGFAKIYYQFLDNALASNAT